MPRLIQVTKMLLFEDRVALHLINLIRSGYRGALQNHSISSQSGDTAPHAIKFYLFSPLKKEKGSFPPHIYIQRFLLLLQTRNMYL